MPPSFKRVPAIDKCFSILELMAESKKTLGFNEIVKNLGLNKSTVFNILHTLNDLDVVEKDSHGLFRLGTRLFILGNAAAGDSDLILSTHPFLEKINNEFKLSTFLGILSDSEVIIVDKAERAHKIKISSEIGMKIPVFAGVAGKALLSQLPDESIDDILNANNIIQYTPNTITDKTRFKKEILKVRETGIAYDMEEYIEGLVAAAVPVHTCRKDLQAAIWSVGLKQDFKKGSIEKIEEFLLNTAENINYRFSMTAGSCKNEVRGNNF